MFNYWIGFVGVFCLLLVLRIPITFRLSVVFGNMCEWLGWDAGAGFFAKEANYCFYYHPEWFPKDLFQKEELEEWRKGVEDANHLNEDDCS